MQFNKPNLENLQKYLDSSKKPAGNDINWWSLPSGMSSIRILPPWDATGLVALPVASHRIEYQEPGSDFKKYTWVCLNKTFGQPCNICEGLQKIKSAGVDTTKYEPTDIKYYVNALVMFDPMSQQPGKESKAPWSHVLLRLPKGVYTWILSCITNPMMGGDITDPYQGIDILVSKEGSGLNTKYIPSLSPNGKSAIPQEVLNNITLYNISEVFATGFEDERIQTLVNSLNTSANYMAGGGVQQAMNVASGYGYNVQPPFMPQPNTPVYQQQPPTMPQQQPPAPPQAPQMPSPAAVATPPVPPMAFGTMAPPAPPAPPSVPIAPTAPVQPQQGAQTPPCMGNYNATNVQCLVCPHEITCQQQQN